jgi:riboflavin kinase / FMN adenylyltransferase
VKPGPVPSRTLCAIGNFDGVHRGHVELLRRTSRDADTEGLSPIVLTFDPPPTAVLGPKAPGLLTPLGRKVDLIRRAAPPIHVVTRPFTRDLGAMSPADFAERLLVGELGVAHVVVGANFRFGKGRSGDLSTLVDLGARLGFVAKAAELLGDERGPLSSTRARAAIDRGDLCEVDRVLGRPHALSGEVVRGDGRGRQLGVPTANLGGVSEMLPPAGVYAVLVDRIDGAAPVALSAGVASVGVRPTFSAGPAIEVHLFDFEGDLYGARLRVHLLAMLRAEQKYPSAEALEAQMRVDVDAARSVVLGCKPDRSGSFF